MSAFRDETRPPPATAALSADEQHLVFRASAFDGRLAVSYSRNGYRKAMDRLLAAGLFEAATVDGWHFHVLTDAGWVEARRLGPES